MNIDPSSTLHRFLKIYATLPKDSCDLKFQFVKAFMLAFVVIPVFITLLLVMPMLNVFTPVFLGDFLWNETAIIVTGILEWVIVAVGTFAYFYEDTVEEWFNKRKAKKANNPPSVFKQWRKSMREKYCIKITYEGDSV